MRTDASFAVDFLIGKLAGMPVYSMAGWYSDGDDDLSVFKPSVVTAREQGHGGVKIEVGRSTLDDDIRRIRMARARLPADGVLLV